MKTRTFALCAAAAVLMTGTAFSQLVSRGDRPLMAVAQQLKNGEFVWAPELSPDGSALLVVNLATQRAILFRNGVPMAASTISWSSRS